MNVQRGFSLVETMLVVAIVLLSVAGSYSLSRSTGRAASSTLVLPSLLDAARELAATTGDGATVLLTPGGAGAMRSFDVTLYRGRPRPGGIFDAGNPARTDRLPGLLQTSLGAGGPIAVFISTAGTVSYAAWSPRQGPIPEEPLCAAPLTLTIDETSRFQLACADANLTRLITQDWASDSVR